MAIRFLDKDLMLFQALAKTGRCTHDLSSKYYNVKYKRLERFVREGYLQKEPIMIDGRATYCYRLSKQGQKLVRENIPTVNHFYKCTTKGTSHDVYLFEAFAKLSFYEQQICLTESDIVEKYGKLKGTSPPDFLVPKYEMISKSGLRRTVKMQVKEVKTKNYTAEDIAEKISYIEELIREEVDYDEIEAK